MATQTNSPSANRSISDISGGDDVFQLIQKNKVWIGLVIALIVIAVLGWGYYSTHKHTQDEVSAAKVLMFQNGTLKELTENKIDAQKAVEGFSLLVGEVGKFSGTLPVGVQLADQLLISGKADLAASVLMTLKPLAKNEYATYVVLSRMAVALEDSGKIDEAIKALEELAQNNLKIFQGKTYLDLGRMYLKKGDKEKARSNFEYVVTKAKDEIEFVKIANLYLGQM